MVGEKIEALLKQVDAYRHEFYAHMIPVHENKALRALAANANQQSVLSIYKPRENYMESLWYNKSGFAAGIPVHHSKPDWDSGGYYEQKMQPFTVENGILVMQRKARGEKEELLKLFPKLTVEGIEAVIEQEIKKLEILKTPRGELS